MQGLKQRISEQDIECLIDKDASNPERVEDCSRQKNQSIQAQTIEGQRQNPRRQGYLQLQVEELFTHWKRAYWMLTSQKLYCFEDSRKLFSTHCLNLQLLPLELLLCKEGFILQDETVQHCFRADTPELKDQWCHYLSEVIALHSLAPKLYVKPLQKPIYKMQDVVSEQQFLSQCSTGDILLMQTRNTFSCALQRLVTNSSYDHIALAVRINDQVKLFEANENDGVQLYDWNQYHIVFDRYRKIAWRKLYHQSPETINEYILKFVKGAIGMEYELTTAKLFRKESEEASELDKSHSKRGYFCSQLIAKAYKCAGLLDISLSSARYWPVDFTEKGSLILRQHAYFGRENLIVLNRHLRKTFQ